MGQARTVANATKSHRPTSLCRYHQIVFKEAVEVRLEWRPLAGGGGDIPDCCSTGRARMDMFERIAKKLCDGSLMGI
jgi:hypothetical protein